MDQTQEYYVDEIAGSDSNSGLSPDKAFKTVDAVPKVFPDGKIILHLRQNPDAKGPTVISGFVCHELLLREFDLSE